MNNKKDLEIVLKEEVNPVIDAAIKKYIGVSIEELKKDITEKIKKNPLINVDVNMSLGFRTAKKVFRKEYLERVLRASSGDVSAAAKTCGLDRRTIHRMIVNLGIDVSETRKNRLKSQYIEKGVLSNAIGSALEQYKDILHPKKMKKFYKEVPGMSEKIIKSYPLKFITLKKAEEDFEKRFILKALEKSKGNVSRAARVVGLRQETLHRKIKELGIKR